MSSVVLATRKLNEGINEVMTFYLKDQGFDLDSLKNMDENTFKALQSCLRLMDTAQELQMVTARTLDDMNRKIDEMNVIISRLEKKVH